MIASTRSRSWRAACAAVTFLLSAAIPASTAFGEQAVPPGSERVETRTFKFTKDGGREVVVTPEQKARRAERKARRKARHAAEAAQRKAAAAKAAGEAPAGGTVAPPAATPATKPAPATTGAPAEKAAPAVPEATQKANGAAH